MSSVVRGCAASAAGSNASMSARLVRRLIGAFSFEQQRRGHRTPFYARSSSMKIRRDFLVGITTVCCVPLLASCGGTEPAQEAAASAASSTPAAAPVGQGVADADWPTYNRTLAGDRF